jgi:MFS family permease
VFVYLASGDDPYYNMRKDLDMTDERYALVKGTVFTLINSIFGLLFGYLADSFNRKWILVITTVAYTLMTLASAYVHTFVQVLIPRILFSFFMAACIPVSVSLINDYFSHEWRGRANSMFAFGIYLGGGLSSLTALVNEKFG